MIYIDRAGMQPDHNWLERADDITNQMILADDEDVINYLIDQNENLWGELKDFLLSVSNNKCWYSESKDSYAHYHVDHFRPKKEAINLTETTRGYWWLAFEWSNYRISGGAGNVRKGTKFAVKRNKANTPEDSIEDEIIYFLDPCEDEDVTKITFIENGEIIPINNAGWDFERANYTIRNLNLNFKLLKEKRKETWTKCYRLLMETQHLIAENDFNPSAMRRGQIKEKIKQLKELVKSTSEFSATAKACLRSTGLSWALQIAA